MKLTPWFPPDVKPVHVGMYNTSGDFKDWWDGQYWYCMTAAEEYGLEPVDTSPRYRCSIQDQSWRGLARNSK